MAKWRLKCEKISMFWPSKKWADSKNKESSVFARSENTTETLATQAIEERNFSKDTYNNGNVKKQESDWLKRKNNRTARVAWISVHFFAVLHKTSTWNHQILGCGDNVSI